MSEVSNGNPLIKTVELLKKEADLINKNYRSQALSITLKDYAVVNDENEKSTGLVNIGGKKINWDKFCTAELGSRYVDLIMGSEREPKTTDQIMKSVDRVSYSDAQLITGETDSNTDATIFFASNETVKANISKQSEVPGQSPKNLSKDIFTVTDKDTAEQTFYNYACSILASPPANPSVPPVPNAQANAPQFKNDNLILSQRPQADRIERYNAPGMTFISHKFGVDKKSLLGINFTLQDADILHAFLNGLTTVDLAKAITFLRIGFFAPSDKVFTRGSKSGADKDSVVRPPISLSSFLGMSPAGGLLERTYGQASASDLIKISAGQSPFLRDNTLSRLGFELFLSPQTLVNPEINKTLDQSGTRRFFVRDPMVPLASVDSFKVIIQNSPIAAFTTQICEIRMTVHDKSRLEELSNFIAVQEFPSNFVEVEYGYSHPDSDPVTGTAVGRFLNLMRMKQVFIVAGYNMTVKDQSAEITLKLVSQAERALTAVPCVTGSTISINTILQYLNNLSLPAFPDMLAKDAKAFDPSTSSGRMVSRRAFVNLVEAVNLATNYSEDPNVKRALRELQESIKKSGSLGPSDLTPNQLQVSLLNTAAAYNLAETGGGIPDAFFNKMSIGGFNFAQKFRSGPAKLGNFVSAAQLISRFVLAPLASSTVFDEVQIHCFSFNDRAGYLSKQPISVCPIDMKDLRESMSKGGTEPQRVFSTAEMLNKILRLCSNPYNIGFGVSDPLLSLQKARQAAEEARADSEDATQPDGPPAVTDPEKAAQTALDTKIKQIYNEVYPGVSIEDPVFKVPVIKSRLQSLKVKRESDGKDLNICRIIIYDESATSLSEISGILGVASEDLTTYQPAVDSTTSRVSQIASGARNDIHIVRGILRKLYPVLKIGHGNSVINGVTVSTSTSGDVAQAQLVEALRGVYGAQQESLPESGGDDITVIPAKISFTMLGCPIVSRGQSVFVDLGTGTTLDNVYTVSSVNHGIDARGNFSTSVTLSPTSSGTVRSVATKDERALKKFPSS